MTYDSVFDSTENQALLVVCARKTIRTAAIVGIIWGAINLVIGFFAMQTNPVNVGILVLGLLMLLAGLSAIRKPSVHSLLTEAVVSLLLLCWNVGIAMINVRAGYADHINGHGVIWPAIAAIAFFRQYLKLGHLKDAISAMDHGMIKEAAALCKQLFKTKLAQSPDIAQATSKRYRVRLMNDSIFCARRNLNRAFHMSRDHFRNCIADPGNKRVKIVVRHPLGKIACVFDKKNSDKIRGWLAINAQPVV
jgi:ribosomal protein S14